LSNYITGVGGFAFNHLINILILELSWRGALLTIAGFAFEGAVFGMLFLDQKEKSENGYDTHVKDMIKVKELTSKVNKANTSLDENVNCTRSCHNFQCVLCDEGASNSDVSGSKGSYDVQQRMEALDLTTTKDNDCSVTTADKKWSLSVVEYLFPRQLVTDGRMLLVLAAAAFFQMAYVIPFSLLADEAMTTGLSRYHSTWLVATVGENIYTIFKV